MGRARLNPGRHGHIRDALNIGMAGVVAPGYEPPYRLTPKRERVPIPGYDTKICRTLPGGRMTNAPNVSHENENKIWVN
jgi:hypothetical protein